MQKVLSCQVAVVAIFVLFMLTTTAEAGNRAGAFTLSPMAGAQIFQQSEEVDNTDFYGLHLGYNFTKHFGSELVGTGAAVDRQPAGTGDFNYWTGRLDLLYHFQPDELFVPYVSAGIGGAFLAEDGGIDEDLIVAYGVGFKYFTTDWLALRIDARQLWRHEMTYKPTDHGKNYKNYMLSGGLTFQMGGAEPALMQEIDTDHDGIIDATDLCPGTPAGVSVDANGCPLDTDGDGVIDAVDQCPWSSTGAKVDALGCETIVAAALIEDADGDGVADRDDKCPNTPADVPVNERGCPADSDFDGVFDVDDLCPDTPRDRQVDPSGCEIDYSTMEELQLEITFASNSSVIDAKFDVQMQQAADFIKAHPGERFLVEGHTDNTGSAAANMRLSQKRADTVRWVLVRDYGVKKDHLTAKGFGDSDPIADNSSQSGRMANRRVLIRVVD
ncbi:MAG: OmpA family protein [Desulfuromonadales bacterium]|nr:OmpA family protein [Desulfuromonadales bacterium]